MSAMGRKRPVRKWRQLTLGSGLRETHPGVTVLGGCGIDLRHVGAIADSCLPTPTRAA